MPKAKKATSKPHSTLHQATHLEPTKPLLTKGVHIQTAKITVRKG